MHPFRFKTVAIFISLVLGLALPQTTPAQFYNFTRAIPEKDSTGAPLAGANTTFADGTVFQPVGDSARSSSWAWRPYGDDHILSSLGLNSSTPPTNTRELVTTVGGLKPSADYQVKVLFWGASAQFWGVRAGLNYARGSRTNLWFDLNASGVVKADLLAWEIMPSIFSESGRTLYAATLGRTNANSNGQIKIFIHDLPATDSNYRTWYQGVAVAEIIPPGPNIVDAASPGTAFHRGVRGLALSDPQINWSDYWVGLFKTLEVARGSSIRGVSTGLAADRYDWRTRNGQPRPTTLEFLRYSRDFASELFLGVNMRGLIQPNPDGGWLYYDTNITTLAPLAADWVRYVNHIVPTYRHGNSITNSRDAAILDSIIWSSDVPGDSFDKLLPPGEAPVPLIQYWEIGNEPTVGVTSFSVSNSFTMDAADYYARYKGIVEAIKAENPAAKVGPTLVNGTREQAQLAAIASDHSLPIDFITYHPYERMGVLDDPAQITLHLGSVYSRQLAFYNGIKKVVADSGRNPEAIEYAATEVNVSYWDINDTPKEATMAHALGTVETVFSHARLGLVASHYWIWPAHRADGTAYPLFKAYEKLRDHLGDTLVSVYAAGDIRIYTTRESRTGELAVWALNFSGSENTTVNLQLKNLPNVQRATLLRLQDKSGTTTLFSSNLASDMPGGPTLNVDWTTSDITGQDLSSLPLNLPAATLALLVIEPGLDRIEPVLSGQGGDEWLFVRFRKIPFASDVRYRLLGSTNLTTWETVTETGSGESDWVTIPDSFPLKNSPHRFLRVETVRP